MDYLAVSVLFCRNGYLNGCEKMIFTMINCCCGALVIRVPLLFILTRLNVSSLGWYGLISPISSMVMLAVIGFYMLGQKIRLRKKNAQINEKSYGKSLWGEV